LSYRGLFACLPGGHRPSLSVYRYSTRCQPVRQAKILRRGGPPHDT